MMRHRRVWPPALLPGALTAVDDRGGIECAEALGHEMAEERKLLCCHDTLVAQLEASYVRSKGLLICGDRRRCIPCSEAEQSHLPCPSPERLRGSLLDSPIDAAS